ncbi:MAG: glycosyltransferase [Bacteroidales bacterium]|nr:glycosyltransferase [Bacteroidales bacterium]
MKNENLFSIILLSYYSGERINNCFEKVSQRMTEEKIPFEFIIIDDGSKDKSIEIAKELEKANTNVKAYQLSKNYTSHYAIFAGLSMCKGTCATVMPDDFQQPLDSYVEMYRKWEEGNKIVIPYRINRNDGFVKDFFSKSYYKIMNILSVVNYPSGGFDIFLIDREIVEIINNRISSINTSATIEILRLGYDPLFIPFDRPKVNTKSRWTFKKKVKLAADSFFSSSNFPIRLISILGLLTSVFSILLILFTIIVKLTGNENLGGFSIPGWATTVIFISFFSGLILFSLGIIAEYIWRIYEEVKNRPGYIIKKKNTSEDEN